jgi:hypothetical protein
MSKNQGGIVQYVDFHREEPVKIIHETRKSSSRKSKVSEPKTEKSVQKTAELVQFIKPIAEVSPEIAVEVKKVKKVVSVKKPAKKAAIVAEKTNNIRAFFEKNKAYYDIEGALSSTKDSKITILKDVTNEKIHKKAVNAIIKSIKSSRKFKLELAS